MTEEQINVLVKYLGSWCRYVYRGEQIVAPLSLGIISSVSWDSDYILFQLNPKPLSSLTQEDFDRMNKELWARIEDIEPVHYWRGYSSIIEWKEADWLRNNGYYLGEELIEPFVKLKEL